MAKIKKGFTAEVTGLLNIDLDDSNRIFVEVEDVEDPIDLAEFISEFNGKDVKISVAYKQEM